MSSSNLSEEWRPVVGYEGRYEVSDRGQVRGLDRLSTDGKRLRGKLLLQSLNNGYPVVNLCLRKPTRYYVHTLVLETFRGAPPAGFECRHIDSNPRNNQLHNLAWGTPLQNTADKLARGTQFKNPAGKVLHAKLTEAQVRAALRMKASGMTHRQVADRLGVGRGCIKDIATGKTWRHIERVL